MLLLAAALLPPLPAAALVVLAVVFVLGVLGREGGVVSLLGAAVMIAGGVVVALVAVVALVVLPLLGCEALLELTVGDGEVSGAHAGASNQSKLTNLQHTFRIHCSFKVVRAYVNIESVGLQQQALLLFAPKRCGMSYVKTR